MIDTQAKMPITPKKGLPPEISPKKRQRVKRKAISPISKELPIKKATGLLYQAKKAVLAALEAKKENQGSEYIEDNDIQLLANDLNYILKRRESLSSDYSLESIGI